MVEKNIMNLVLHFTLTLTLVACAQGAANVFQDVRGKC
jgi:hypothetical protein